MSEVRLTVKDFDDSNRREKFTRAVETLSKAMKVPLTVRPKDRERGEKFVYEAEGDLVKRWTGEFAGAMDTVYLAVCGILDLPRVTTFSKAIGDPDRDEQRPASEALHYRGKVVFNPETGKPIYREDFEKIVKAIEKFLNKRLEPMGREIVLNAVALGRVMARKLLTLPSDEVRKLRLPEVEFDSKPFTWISETLERQDKLFGAVRPEERARMLDHYKGIASAVQVAEESMGDHITQMVEDTQHAVRRAIIDGVKGRLSKKEIAQDLFNRMGNLNRDWGRIAETETVESFNNAFLRETAAAASSGEKVYFRRVEMRDQYVCNFCEKIRGQIALWVDHPLADDKIDDPVAKVAIWGGKSNIGKKSRDYRAPAGTVHPWCRGSWERYFPAIQSK